MKECHLCGNEVRSNHSNDLYFLSRIYMLCKGPLNVIYLPHPHPAGKSKSPFLLLPEPVL